VLGKEEGPTASSIENAIKKVPLKTAGTTNSSEGGPQKNQKPAIVRSRRVGLEKGIQTEANRECDKANP